MIMIYLGGFGAGRFYVRDYVIASVKLCLLYITCCISCMCIVGCILDKTGNEDLNRNTAQPTDNMIEEWKQKLTGEQGITACIGCCGCCAWFVWVIVDWFLFGLNVIPDAEGKTLYPM